METKDLYAAWFIRCIGWQHDKKKIALEVVGLLGVPLVEVILSVDMLLIADEVLPDGLQVGDVRVRPRGGA
jgi:hypothetical protein